MQEKVIDKEFGGIKKAIALRYDMQSVAPKVVAIGAGELAERIVQIAQANNIPLERNDTLASVMFKLDVNRVIPPETFKIVASIFAFLFKTDMLWRERYLQKLNPS